MALTQQGMFGNQNLSPFLQDFVNRTGANFGSNMQPVVQPPVLYQGALGLFNRVGPDYCQLNPNDVNCKPTIGDNREEPPQEPPTTAQLIDQYNIITNPLTKGIFSALGTIPSLMLGVGTYIAEENITDALTKGGPSTGGLTDRFGRAITDKDQIPNKDGLFSSGKDFEKALALSLDPFTASGLKVSPDVAALMPPPVDLPRTEYDETGGGSGYDSPSEDPTDQEYGGGGGEDMF